jgi:hypothetical protein
MIENINTNDRKEILKLITIGICLLELLIAICTFFYQQDTRNRTETPISEEMAKVYIDHPEKLKNNERLAINRYSSDQKAYIIVSDEIIRHDFPWKGWILISIGSPITLAFLIVLVAKAYFQVAELEKNESEEVENKWVKGLNTLSKINIVLIVSIFAIWYIPDILKSAGNITITWLNQYWWLLVLLIILSFIIVSLWFFLQYRLKLKVMQMNMEIEKLKYLRYDAKTNIIAPIKENIDPIMLLDENQSPK